MYIEDKIGGDWMPLQYFFSSQRETTNLIEVADGGREVMEWDGGGGGRLSYILHQGRDAA